MNTKQRILRVVSIMMLIAIIATLAFASDVQAATTYRTPYWIRVNLFAEHKSYGVFIIPAGHQNPRLYFMAGNTSVLLGSSQCGAINAITGPGYINDPNGMNSAYVPKGSIGLGICASTSTLWSLKLRGYNIYDSSRWRLYYDY